jgi:hypothetical protein
MEFHLLLVLHAKAILALFVNSAAKCARNMKKMKTVKHLNAFLIINAPLILKMRDIFFFAGKLHNGPFQGIFRGGQGNFGGQKRRGPLGISREKAHYVVCPKQKKIISQIFKISGALVFLCPYCATPHPK